MPEMRETMAPLRISPKAKPTHQEWSVATRLCSAKKPAIPCPTKSSNKRKLSSMPSASKILVSWGFVDHMVSSSTSTIPNLRRTTPGNLRIRLMCKKSFCHARCLNRTPRNGRLQGIIVRVQSNTACVECKSVMELCSLSACSIGGIGQPTLSTRSRRFPDSRRGLEQTSCLRRSGECHLPS